MKDRDEVRRRRRTALRFGIFAVILLVLLLQAALVVALVFPELRWFGWLSAVL